MNCSACRYSYMEPDSGLICGHPTSGVFGKTIRKEPLEHCGWDKFEQHPLRNPDGTLNRSIGGVLDADKLDGRMRFRNDITMPDGFKIFTSGEDIKKGDLVYIKSEDGLAYVAGKPKGEWKKPIIGKKES